MEIYVDDDMNKIMEWWDLIGGQARGEMIARYFSNVGRLYLTDDEIEMAFYIHVFGF